MASLMKVMIFLFLNKYEIVCPIARIMAPAVPIVWFISSYRFPSAQIAYSIAINEVNTKVFDEICWNF